MVGGASTCTCLTRTLFCWPLTSKRTTEHVSQSGETIRAFQPVCITDSVAYTDRERGTVTCKSHDKGIRAMPRTIATSFRLSSSLPTNRAIFSTRCYGELKIKLQLTEAAKHYYVGPSTGFQLIKQRLS